MKKEPEKTEKQRSIPQNSGMHKGFDLLATALNESGLYKKMVLQAFGETWWTPHAIKEDLFKPVMKAMYGYESTTELKTGEVSPVWEQIMAIIGEKFGVHIPFPSQENSEEYLNSYENHN